MMISETYGTGAHLPDNFRMMVVLVTALLVFLGPSVASAIWYTRQLKRSRVAGARPRRIDPHDVEGLVHIEAWKSRRAADQERIEIEEEGRIRRIS